MKKNLSHLQKDRFAFVRKFFDRIEEIRYIQKRLWKIVEDNPDKSILQKSCLSELHQSTLTLCNLYDALPAVIAVRPDFINGGYEDGERDSPLYLNSYQRENDGSTLMKYIHYVSLGSDIVRVSNGL